MGPLHLLSNLSEKISNLRPVENIYRLRLMNHEEGAVVDTNVIS